MAKQEIKSTSITSDVRDQLNENFTEIYSDKVPYTGATGPVDLGVQPLVVGEIQSTGNLTINCGTNCTIVLQELVWEDLRFPATTTKLGATSKPDFDYTNVGLLFPQNDATEITYINVQMPHAYSIGTDIVPHVHFIQSAATVPVFKMSYRWYDMGESAIGAFTTIATSTLVYTYTSGSIHQLAKFPNIVCPVTGMSSMLDIKLYREDNVVTGDVLVKEFDIHYQIDTIGSSTESSKFQGD